MKSISAIDPGLLVRQEVDLRRFAGPFDIVGDVHGCAEELQELLVRLGFAVHLDGTGAVRRARVAAPHGRRAVFVGDLVDRGPCSPDALRIVMALAAETGALCALGNHDAKFRRWLDGRHVNMTHGIDRTVEQFSAESAEFRAETAAFLDGLPYYLWLDGGRLAVAHAGIKEEMLGRTSGTVRAFCLYGETSGEKDRFGLTIRYHWALDYRGSTAVVYGHTPVPEAAWVNRTLCVDTGCVFGGKLSALRWPEKEIVSVPARQAYAVSKRPFGHPPPRPGAALASRTKRS
ncbi:MAG: metallophosphoesterase [Hyphomicrobiaceae bacterium]